jgi:2,4-dienoyl-CoA reductase-like NADH-dependent reductase (Old Yellow Enzyme family)
MSRTPARITQADVARTIRAARQAGAPAVEIHYADGTVIRVPLTDSVEITGPDLASIKEIVL